MSHGEVGGQAGWGRCVIVGGGRVGRLVALMALGAGNVAPEIAAIWSRRERGDRTPVSVPWVRGALPDSLEGALAGARAVWLTVTDDALEGVARALAPSVGPGTVVLHTSGSHSSQILRDAGMSGPVGSLHPLMAISDPHEALGWVSQVTWTVEGEDDAVAVATELLAAWGAGARRIAPEAKLLYHASAVTAANLLVSLMDASFVMADAAGFAPEEARAMLLPLARTSLANLEHRTPAEAITGPVARGDEDVIARHIEALERLGDANAREIYERLTERARGFLGRGGGEGG